MPGLNTQSPRKLAGYDFYHKVSGSPTFVVAPMVDQSELVGVAKAVTEIWWAGTLIYTPMINAKMFAEGNRKPFREQNFNIACGEEGGPEDRPLIVQFCANDPDQLLASAKIVEPYCDAVDINLGCPQEIAKKGHYGSFLQDEWELIYSLINTLHTNLSIPVTAKFRVFPTVEKTVEYAKMLERAGAQILTCHGRLREQRGQRSGLADWDKIRAVKAAVSVPVFANGNILVHTDVARCLAETGADAVMSAEGNLYNPAIFLASAPSSSSLLPPPTASSASPSEPTQEASTSDSSTPPSPLPPSESDPTHPETPSTSTPPPLPTHWHITSPLTGYHPAHTTLASSYLALLLSQRTPTSPSAIKGHLFKLMRPALGRETDLREKLGRVVFPRIKGGKGEEAERRGFEEGVRRYKEVVGEMERRMLRDAHAANDKTICELVYLNPDTGLYTFPHWVAQPYVRPLPVEDVPNKPPKIPVAVKRAPAEADRAVEVDEVVAATQADQASEPEEGAAAAAKRTAYDRSPDESTKRLKLADE
ncbi:hypothetical protein EIP91_005873 [Steccherinum ochraceum]|uniref:tRNA-dihydrouridine(16/17) synthase [NAD(P)(+)] n=1 Tax=Steccherinum ochraceum TaxID=92696 RepID=A0A4R0R962_9APHY|nr:hypothetical protein EIP91_005873 [Steccherinum ochraceum]